MSAPINDPLNDPAYANRLAKLLPMLGSAQSEEADVARRKLIEHLGAQGLTLLDLANRLQRQVLVNGNPAANPSGTPRAGEADRQIAGMRSLLAETQAEMTQSQGVAAELQRAVDRLALLANKLRRARDRAILLASLACLAGGIAVAVDLAPVLNRMLRTAPLTGVPGMPMYMQTGDEAERSALLPPGPGETAGTAAVQDLAVRYEPHDDAGVRAYLNRGTPVVIMRQVVVSNRNWLFVRSASGMGWARSGDVLR